MKPVLTALTMVRWTRREALLRNVRKRTVRRCASSWAAVYRRHPENANTLHSLFVRRCVKSSNN